MTKRKLSLTVVSAVLAAIFLIVGICAIVAHSKDDKTEPTAELATWQSMIKDETLLKDVVIAGAHDAGTIGLPYFAATQDKNIYELLYCGTRYFDLRVSYVKKKSAEGQLLIYHGPSKGIALAAVLDEVLWFLKSHPTENIILDFQHFEEPEKYNMAQSNSLKLVETMLKGMTVTNTTDKTDAEFVDSLTLGEVRGKCIVFWGRETEDILAKNYVFKRNDDNCGRENSALHSYYDGSLNKKSSSYYVKNALPRYLELYKTNGNVSKGLKVLQGQLTDGLYVFGPRFREATHTVKMNNYLENLATNAADLPYVNIVIRDFITPSKNCNTLQLNLSKNVVKTDSVAAFEKMIADNIK